jgi:hypothetical protein
VAGFAALIIINRKSSLLVGLLVLVSVSFGFAGAQTDAIRKGALRCATSLQRGVYETFVKLTYPNLVEFFGGREKMIAITKALMKANGLKVISLHAGQPSQPVSSNQKLFSVVPTITTMSGLGERIRQKPFLLAISTDSGSTWTLLDGSGLTPELRAKILPDLPSALALPRKEPPTIERTN